MTSGLVAGEAGSAAGFVLALAAGEGDEALAGAVDAEGEGWGDAAGTDSDCKTECEPVKAG